MNDPRSDAGALLGRLAEVAALARVRENNDWHDDDVLQQSLRLFEASS